MDRLIPEDRPALRRLCRVDEIPQGGAKGFAPAPGCFTGLFAVRQAGGVRVYVNACPHLGVSLDWAPDRFLTADGQHIVCSTHGALFRPDDGACIHGPCMGAALEAVLIHIIDEIVFVPESAGC
ncbi:MAG: Rieske 2Fe-2S domain-containing protein [Rhodospirillales bacterium]|nr:Rieske 2Fe-2S domain-containing protein [Rhodospirillales bacterium]MDE2199332.1 Rieske 2Fe-2S domain-containing protein [Rhodospirillales bacterium]MDE2575925.1 Rieske 2Fe-2S domain-containing protein [Rhodospirillales bacterium]